MAIGLGVFFLVTKAAIPKYAIAAKVMGGAFIMFYGWLLVCFFIKLFKGTWKEYCDKYYLFFAERG